MALSEPEAPDR